MNPGDLCICGHTREVHFGRECSKVNCRCKEFALLDAAVEIYEALKALEEQVADFRAGRTWDADYVGLKQAHLKAKVAIRKAQS